jgi:hypothetical protein
MGSLKKKELQNFLKRLRKNAGFTFRYFACGEYGKKGRPHYHILLFADGDFNVKFGYDPVRRKKDVSIAGDFHKAWSTRIRIHDITDKFHIKSHRWRYGMVDAVPIINVKENRKVAAYVCKYVLKKLTEEKKCLPGLEYQFFLMSRGNAKDGKKGIGYAYALKIANAMKKQQMQPLLSSDAYPIESNLQMIRIDGKLWPMPRYLRELIKSHFSPDESSESQKFWRRYFRNVAQRLSETEEEVSKASVDAQKAFQKYLNNRKL